MAYDERLALRIRQILRRRSDITERRMFGGLAFLCDGRMCCGINGRDLVVRVAPADMAAALARAHVRPMGFTVRPVRGFLYVAPAGVRTTVSLKEWIDHGLRFVATDQPHAGIRSNRKRVDRSRVAHVVRSASSRRL